MNKFVSETKQRSHLLLPVSNPPRAEVHTLGKCSAQRLEAFQLAT